MGWEGEGFGVGVGVVGEGRVEGGADCSILLAFGLAGAEGEVVVGAEGGGEFLGFLLEVCELEGQVGRGLLAF